MLLAGGFVLGEVLILQTNVVLEMLASAALPVLACGLWLWLGLGFKPGDPAPGRGTGRVAGLKAACPGHRWEGRSLWLWLLPVFILAGMGQASFAREACAREEALGLDGRIVVVAGRVDKAELGEEWLVLELTDAAIRPASGQGASGTLGRVQVYLEAGKTQREEADGKDQGGRKAGALARTPSIRVGNQVEVKGECTAFGPARNPGEFDYRMYYRSLNLHWRVFALSWEVTDGRTDLYRDGLRRASEWAGQILNQVASPEKAGVFRAIILGRKDMLSEEIRGLYQDNGIAHLLAVSGLHLSLVSLAAYGLLRKAGAGYGAAGLAGTVALVSYALLTGASPSVLRALVMVLCGFLAAYLGRTYDLLTALGLAALLLLWDSPYRACQAGVQLSFGAVFAIGGLAPCLGGFWAGAGDVGEKEKAKGEEKSEDKGRERRGKNGEGSSRKNTRGKTWENLRQGLWVAVCMQLATLPMVLFHFFQYPLYGIFLNLLVVPLVGIVVASGCGGILLGGLSLGAGGLAAAVGSLVLEWYELCCRFFGSLPGSSLILGRPRFWQIGLYYGIMAVAAWQARRARAAWEAGGGKAWDGPAYKGQANKSQDGSRQAARQSRRLLPVLVIAAAVTQLPLPVRGLEAAFLDVGQGDGICLRTRQGVILVDGGSTDEKKVGENRLEPYLKSRAEGTVEYAVITHGDLDHISGIQYLLSPDSDIRIRNIVLPAAGFGDEVYSRLADLAREAGCRVFWMQRGDTIRMGDLKLACLYPGAGGNRSDDRNSHSLVLRADYGTVGILLTGDMGGENEEELLGMEASRESQALQVQVLKAAHHGSRFSSTEHWLEAVRPEWAVISYGEGNSYGHPHEETLKRLGQAEATALKTGESGAVILHTDGKKMWWDTWLGGMPEL